jgi:hypothetical protein
MYVQLQRNIQAWGCEVLPHHHLSPACLSHVYLSFSFSDTFSHSSSVLALLRTP